MRIGVLLNVEPVLKRKILPNEVASLDSEIIKFQPLRSNRTKSDRIIGFTLDTCLPRISHFPIES